MIDRVNLLRDNRDTYAENLRQLLILYSKHPTALFCAFEGEDAKYYGIRIEHFSGYTERINILCKGKYNVLRLYDRVISDNQLKHAVTAFFIDHDFDGLCGYALRSNLYITPCYSIENLYLRREVVRRIFVEEFGVSDFHDYEELNGLLVLFDRLLAEFIEAVTTLNAWIALQRDKEATGRKLHLNSQGLNRFVAISLQAISPKYNLEQLRNLFPTALEISEAELDEKETAFREKDRLNLFRGKYFIEFLRIFLELLKEDSNSHSPAFFKSKRKIRLHLTKDNILSELSQYAETPPCLKQFLENLSDRAVNTDNADICASTLTDRA